MANKRNKHEDMNMQSALTTQEIGEKTKGTTAKQKEPGFLREVWQQIRLAVRLMGDPEVPFYFKFVPFLGVLYVIMPIDLIPDVFLMAGQVDDIAILLAGAKLFIELAPPHVVARHLQEIRIKDGYEVVLEGELVDNLNDTIIIDPDSGKTIVQKEPEDLK